MQLRVALFACVAALATAGCRSHAAEVAANEPAPVAIVQPSVDDDDGDRVGNDHDRCPDSSPRQAIGPDGCPVPHVTGTWVNFDFDSDALTVQARALLAEYAQQLATGAWHEVRFEIVGHADACGSTAYNRALSGRRARSVGGYLLTHGVDPAQIVRIYGKGESRPLDPAPRDGCRSETNRRVELNAAR